MITVDDVIDVIKDEATEDLYRLAGVSSDERVFTPASESLRKRMPWLIVNLATAFLAAAVVGVFQETIGAWVALAVFMPIVAGMGGNAATQTLTVIIRGIALGELTWSNSRKALLKNLLVGVGNGVVTGTIAAVVAWLMNGDFRLGIILGAGDGHQPVRCRAGRYPDSPGVKALKIDPALASAVFITTFTDVCGLRRSLDSRRSTPGTFRARVEGACRAGSRRAKMPLYSADALILRTYKLAEADRIVVFLTRDRGKKRGVAKGARRTKSNFVGALEPLTHVRVAYFEKERREL